MPRRPPPSIDPPAPTSIDPRCRSLYGAAPSTPSSLRAAAPSTPLGRRRSLVLPPSTPTSINRLPLVSGMLLMSLPLHSAVPAGVWSPKSRIHPLQISLSLTRASCEALHQSIQEVVKYAVEVDADCDRFPVGWMFHRHWGKKPGTVDGKKIEFITAGGRTRAYMPQLQKLIGIQSRKLTVANPRQLSEDSISMESETEGEDDLNPRKRVATFMAAIGQKTKDAASAHSRKTGKNAGGSKEKTSMKRRDPEDDVEITEPKKIGASSSNDEHGFDKEPTARPGEISDHVRRKLVPYS